MVHETSKKRDGWRAERQLQIDQMNEISNRSPLLDPLPYKLFFHLLCGRLQAVKNEGQFRAVSAECRRLSDEVFRRIADIISPENLILALVRGDLLIDRSENADPPNEFVFVCRALDTDDATPVLGDIIVTDQDGNRLKKQISSLVKKG
ncbi:MAG: hypothetical protein AAB489_03145 [Patescibacteria group bacterium]